MNLRILSVSDAPAAEAFLAAHRDSSMFLRSNIRRAGLDYRPEPYHSVYAGAFSDGRIHGIVAHSWSGMLLLQAPEGVAELSIECVRLSKRQVGCTAGDPQGELGHSGRPSELRRRTRF